MYFITGKTIKNRRGGGRRRTKSVFYSKPNHNWEYKNYHSRENIKILCSIPQVQFALFIYFVVEDLNKSVLAHTSALFLCAWLYAFHIS